MGNGQQYGVHCAMIICKRTLTRAFSLPSLWPILDSSLGSANLSSGISLRNAARNSNVSKLNFLQDLCCMGAKV